MGKIKCFKSNLISIASLVKITLLFLFVMKSVDSFSQSNQQEYYKVEGVVYELSGSSKIALPYASVGIQQYSIGQPTDEYGEFELQKVPKGTVKLTVKYMGKLDIDTIISVDRDLKLNFVMKDENFNLKEVTVTAENTKAGQSTASLISKNAMDHLQANSLTDVLSLLPGGIIGKRTLNEVGNLTIRDVSDSASGSDSKKQDGDLNSLGVSIITDGAPLSNNANLQTLNSTLTGQGTALGGIGGASTGVDLRTIGMDNVESVEVIRGVPSVQHGDVTSGVVIVNTKAGREPFNVTAKANQNIYELSLGHGLSLGEKKGSLHLSANYAHSTTKPEASYLYYQRVNSKGAYSNVFFDGMLTNNTSLNLSYGRDRMKVNPDKEKYQEEKEGEDLGFRLNTNGLLNLNRGILKTIRYVASASYAMKDSYYQKIVSNATAPYSMTTNDGTILSNRPGEHIYDKDGNQLTNFGDEDRYNHAIYLPASYLESQNIEGRELNVFAKLSANFFKRFGNTDNKLLAGIDFKLDKNYGDGKTFDPQTPPWRMSNNPYASFRSRRFKDVPAIKQLGLFAEENFSYSIGGHLLELQAGIRYDHMSVVKGVFSPRFNGSIEIWPNVLTLRGGYGITAKAPTLFYLYPENAYFEFININELIDDENGVFMTTTKVYDAQNKDMKVAKNKRAEVGIDLKINKATLTVTAFNDRLKNGYGMHYTYMPYSYKKYTRVPGTDNFEQTSETNLLNAFYKPTNNKTIKTKGVEFDLTFKRFDAIRTAFSINGAWIRTESYNTDYYYYNPKNDGTLHVAVYDKELYKQHYERISTALRITHNIPEIGFVVTLTGQTIWRESDWYHIGNEEIPVKYISTLDGKMYDFPSNFEGQDEFEKIIMNTDPKKRIKESYPPIFCFNINVTKELGEWARLSFFSNNMFRSYPIVEKKRELGTYKKRNEGLFTFGVELALTIK